MANPFEAPGSWLRCALHAHTTNSDGELSPELLVRHYERAGFDVLAITDHWVRTEQRSSERLLVLPGTELNARLGPGNREAHVLALGVEADPERPLAEFPTLAETMRWVEEHGGVPYLAHPYWSGLRSHDLERCDGVAGLEVFNAGCELETGRGVSGVHWDEVLESGRTWLGIATDDCHHPGFDSALAWTWVRAAERSRAAVLEALREGCFYSSTGPELELVAVDGATVEVRCSPAQRITLLTGPGRGSTVGAGRLAYCFRGEIVERDASGYVTGARLAATRTAPYARLEVKDASGATAWTNPLWSESSGRRP